MLQVTPVLVILMFLFYLLSIVYIYKYRGHLRFQSFTEYTRKGWPIFAPLNCFFYLMSHPRAQKSIMDINDFNELQLLLDNWEIIRQEAQALWKNNSFEQTKDPNNKAYYDIGFKTFYKYGWGKYYLNWYGYNHQSALISCPKTVELIKQIKSVNGAMFSVLPAGSKLTRHLDPLACSLRFHLALDTPESNDCFINVDGSNYSWRKGDAFIFDETYLHHANNNSDEYRLILMCDIERPMNVVGKLINQVFKLLMKITVVPNTSVDKSGLLSTVFRIITPFLIQTKTLKKSHPKKYKLGKWILNTTLVLLLFAILSGLTFFAIWLTSLL